MLVWIKGCKAKCIRTTPFSKETRSCPGWDSNPRHSAFQAECSSYWATRAAQQAGLQIYNTTQHKAKSNPNTHSTDSTGKLNSLSVMCFPPTALWGFIWHWTLFIYSFFCVGHGSSSIGLLCQCWIESSAAALPCKQWLEKEWELGSVKFCHILYGLWCSF